jgi:hypothetical protein
MHAVLGEYLMSTRQAEFAQEAARLQRDHGLRLTRPPRQRLQPRVSVLRWLRQWRPQGGCAPVVDA